MSARFFVTHVAMALALFLSMAVTVEAAEQTTLSPSALMNATAQARATAEDGLATARTRIANERTRLLTEVQDAHRSAGRERERLRVARQQRDERVSALKLRQQEASRETTVLRALIDRAMIAAKLPDAQRSSLAKASASERIAAIVTGVNQRLSMLRQDLVARIQNELVIDRRGTFITAPVLHLGAARAIAVGSDSASQGLLTRTADASSWLIAGPALPASVLVTGISEHTTLPTHIAFDPDNSVVHAHAASGRTLAQWLAGGRFFIWPILAILIFGLLLGCERTMSLMRLSVDPRLIVTVAHLLHRNEHAQAADTVASAATPMHRVLAAGIAARHRPREAREAALDQALLAEAPRFTRGLPALLVMAGIAPLLGLLGTVTGMIDMFSVIAAQGSGNAKALSGGISEALITTQAGMITAIPLLVLHALLARISERRLLLLEEAACGLLSLDDPPPAALP